jgi:hypothetical protein
MMDVRSLGSPTSLFSCGRRVQPAWINRNRRPLCLVHKLYRFSDVPEVAQALIDSAVDRIIKRDDMDDEAVAKLNHKEKNETWRRCERNMDSC